MYSSHVARNRILFSIIATGAAFAPHGASGEEVRLLYEVTQGTYVAVGGFVGVLSYESPNSGFAFLSLTLDTDSRTGTLKRLGANLEPTNGFFFGELLENRLVVGNRIDFTEQVPHPLSLFFPTLIGEMSFAAGFSEVSIQLDLGALYPEVCCDIPYWFGYSNVQGVAIPIDFGDSNQDHKTDLSDLAAIVECVGGPGVEVDPACDFTDRDGDFEVDLTEVALMQRTWNPSAPR